MSGQFMENECRRTSEDICFDETIGHIEDLLVEDEFQAIQRKFLEKYWDVFEPIEENKLIYTDIFREYNEVVESFIVDYLQKVMPRFDMNSFIHNLQERQSKLDGEVFEVLATFTDFTVFKEMFLDYRALKEGKVQDLSSGISVTSVKSFSLESNDAPM